MKKYISLSGSIHFEIYMYIFIQGVSIYMGPVWLLITLLIIMWCSFLFQISKLYTLTTINPWSQCFGQERKISCVTAYLETKSLKTFSKSMQPFNMIMTYYWDKKVKKRLHVLETDIIIFKKNIDLMSLVQKKHFFWTCSKWSPLRLFQWYIIIKLMGHIYFEIPCT